MLRPLRTVDIVINNYGGSTPYGTTNGEKGHGGQFSTRFCDFLSSFMDLDQPVANSGESKSVSIESVASAQPMHIIRAS